MRSGRAERASEEKDCKTELGTLRLSAFMAHTQSCRAPAATSKSNRFLSHGLSRDKINLFSPEMMLRRRLSKLLVALLSALQNLHFAFRLAASAREGCATSRGRK